MTAQWCQRWSEQLPLWQLADPGDRFAAKSYEVHPIADAAAKAYVVRHHYSGTFPAASRRYGLFRAGALVGVAVYSIPAQAAVLTGPLPGLEPYVESLELGRFVLGDAEPGNAESWFLARCHELLAAAGVCGVVSFADPMPRRMVDGTLSMPGHVGVIYQASNAVYTGRGTKRTLLMLPSGATLNDRTMQKIRRQEQGHPYAERSLVERGAQPMRPGDDPAEWLRSALAAVGVRRVAHPGCHRYVFRLGSSSRARARVRVGLAPLPYPKQPDPHALLSGP